MCLYIDTNMMIQLYQDGAARLTPQGYKAIEIADYFNITFEPSGISGLALFLQMIEKKQLDINLNDKIIIISTGKSITSNYY